MLIHIVCWKYRPDVAEADRQNHREQLRLLQDSIESVETLEVGADVLHLERSFDTGLVAHFKDRDALDFYNDHPEHQKVVAVGREIAERVVSVDFLTS